MKIGIDARFYRSSTGGIGRYTRALLDNLAEIDKKNDYTVYITPKDEKEYSLHAKNFTVKVIPIYHYTIQEQIKFLGILNKEKFDLVHFTNFNHPVLYKGKYVVTVHDLTLMLYPQSKNKYSFIKNAAFKFTMANAVNHASAIISDSDATKNDLVKYLKADEKKIKTIYLGIDEEYNKNIKSNSKVLEKYHIHKPYILFLSQWRPHKGIIELIKAYDLFKETENLYDLVLVGKPNEQFPSIIKAINNAKFRKNITIAGFVSNKDLPQIYKNAEIFVFPSHYEGFGLPPLEAMAIGIPVIAGNTSCIPEVLGDAAMYFDPYNPTDIENKIQKLISSDELRKKYINMGFIQAKNYVWKKTVEETIEIYMSVLNN